MSKMEKQSSEHKAWWFLCCKMWEFLLQVERCSQLCTVIFQIRFSMYMYSGVQGLIKIYNTWLGFHNNIKEKNNEHRVPSNGSKPFDC